MLSIMSGKLLLRSSEIGRYGLSYRDGLLQSMNPERIELVINVSVEVLGWAAVDLSEARSVTKRSA